MFLKILPNNRYKNWSIASKLTFLYTFVTSSMLVSIVLLSFWITHKVIITAEMQYIIDEVNIIQDLLNKHSDQLNALTQEVSGVPSALTNAKYHYFIRIFDSKNNTLLQTPNMASAIPDPKFPAIHPLEWQKYYFHWRSLNKKHYLSMSAPLQLRDKKNSRVYMQMALDGTYPEELINQYRFYAIIFLFCAMIIISLIGMYIAQKGLSSLYKLISVTERISAECLTARINSVDWPRELVPLGISINNMLDRIEKSYQRLSVCSTELAHELRTPINNLILATEVTLSRCRNAEEYKTTLESNIEEYRRFSNIIDNILFLARTEKANTIVHKIIIDAKYELNKIVEFYKIPAREKNIDIYIKGDGTVYAELTMFQRAIQNLLANAVQHTPDGGIIQINYKQTTDGTSIIISDNGEGIAESQLELIFERFYRVQSSRQYYSGGIGLGLSIVKSVMELHNGNVTIKSKLDQGTAITLIFPCQKGLPHRSNWSP